MRAKRKLAILILLGLAAIAIICGVAIGPVYVPLNESIRILFKPFYSLANVLDERCLRHLANCISSSHELIILQIRLPRVLLGALVGLSLAVSGVVMQGIFRNPLADPYLLGIAGGASAGAALVIALDLGSIPLALPLGAFLGGISAVTIVYKLAEQRGRTSIYTLILAGVALAALFSATTSFFIFLAEGEKLKGIVFWLMGSLGRANWTYFYTLLPITLIGGLIVMAFARDLNAFSLGEETATHLGIATEKVKKILLATTTLMTAVAVSVSGTIGFIGLITPHALRLIIGPDHRYLLPAAALAGASFLTFSDIAARTIAQPAEFPIGIITASLGAPFFLYLLKRKRGEMR